MDCQHGDLNLRDAQALKLGRLEAGQRSRRFPGTSLVPRDVVQRCGKILVSQTPQGKCLHVPSITDLDRTFAGLP